MCVLARMVAVTVGLLPSSVSSVGQGQTPYLSPETNVVPPSWEFSGIFAKWVDIDQTSQIFK